MFAFTALLALAASSMAAPALQARDTINCTVKLTFNASNYPLSSPLVQAAMITRVTTDFPSLVGPSVNGSDNPILYPPPSLKTAGYAGTKDTYLWNITSSAFPSNTTDVIENLWPGTLLSRTSTGKKLTIASTDCF